MDAGMMEAVAAGKGPAVLVTVLATRGSAPRHAGSKMLWRPGEPLLGTVGGGRLEAAAIAKAEAMAGAASARGKGAAPGAGAAQAAAALIEVEMLGEAALGQDMICGGASLMLVEALGPRDPACGAAAALLSGGRRALFVKRTGKARPGASGDLDGPAAWAVLDEALGTVWSAGGAGGAGAGGTGTAAATSGAMRDTMTMPTIDPMAAAKALATGKPVYDEEGGLFYDPLLPGEKLVILGGGHVGQALARLAAQLDFAITVVDDRAEIDAAGLFPEGTRVLVSGYADAVAALPFDPSTYAVVLTRGHVYDLECARALMGREYRYAGMIGSARKTRLILEQLKAEGLDPSKIEAFCAPIGLDIEAETPAEIAVCILGEMIAFRRNAKALGAMAEARKARRG